MNETSNEDKMKALDLALAQLNKEFGQGSVMKLDEEPKPWPSISTGAATLDLALGIGGLPRGRIVEIYGPESSGKTTICLNTVANAQRAGGRALFIDTEHAVDPIYAASLGVDFESLYFAQPDSGEEALEILDRLIKTRAIDVAIVDSVATLTPQAELDGEMGGNHVGLQSRLMSQALRKLRGVVSKTNTLVIFTNQIREKIGVMYGNPETTPGGRALPFYASVRIDIRRVNKEATKDKTTGEHTAMRVRARTIKNKMAPPFRESFFDIEYGKGIDSVKSIIEVAEGTGIIIKKGAWYSYNGEQLGQGLQNTCEQLKSDIETLSEITQKVYERAPAINDTFGAEEPED